MPCFGFFGKVIKENFPLKEIIGFGIVYEIY